MNADMFRSRVLPCRLQRRAAPGSGNSDWFQAVCMASATYRGRRTGGCRGVTSMAFSAKRTTTSPSISRISSFVTRKTTFGRPISESCVVDMLLRVLLCSRPGSLAGEGR